ncbi:NFACT family protein [Leptolyngbya sp. PCC 6406]|uniref:Rqc2 family fibronectin-binding protein n=1 Tax=Leptolyngbya sp. PCC 6406 TaxID=1173264 RepID=UPI0002ABC53B|nr:NFACT RNA binding domain-containing protein [Leptolyngbya sp. PCC 6406]
MQPVDFTTLAATAAELRYQWLPARCEQVVQRDLTTVAMALRTLSGRGWLTISWHPQAARLHLGEAPPRTPDTFTFSQQLKHQLNGLALVAIAPIAPWERVLDLQFANRPGDPVLWHLYVEIMGRYSNVILVNDRNQVVTAAHQVSEQQSSLRPILTGAPYSPPPSLSGPLPSIEESQDRWQERVALVPAPLQKALLSAYGGLSASLAQQVIQRAELDPRQGSDTLGAADWERLFHQWQGWLHCLESDSFTPVWTETGYAVLGDSTQVPPGQTVQTLLRDYYTAEVNRQTFGRLHNQLSQTLKARLKKLRHKADGFRDRLDLSNQAEQYRRHADLLMAYSHQWQPGMRRFCLEEFETGEPVEIPLEPDKTAIQTAQAFYKKHQKLKRSRRAIEPLLAAVQEKVTYLEQVDAALHQMEDYEIPTDLEALEDIRDELIQQGYLEDSSYRPRAQKPGDDACLRKFVTPGGWEVWIGRNNRQNDLMVSRLASDYDLWFHTQEIPGSHVLLRLSPGAVPSDRDLQYVANLAAYFSRAQQADQVPVVYTEPRHVYKPKGALPGMVIYKQERVLWGQPQKALGQLDGDLLETANPALAPG